MATARDWSVFDRPELKGALGPRSGDGVDALIALDGMHCAACAARAERALAGKVERIHVNISARTIGFRWQPARIAISAVLRALDESGLQPRILAQDNEATTQIAERRRMLLRIGIATICAMQVMMLAWPSYSGAVPEPGIAQLLRWAQWITATPGVLWAGWPFFAVAASAIRSRMPNMDVPVALALAIAYAASTVRTFAGHGDLYFDTATMFVWLLLVGRFLEQRTRAIAGERLRLLAGRRALTASRRNGANTETVPIAALNIGDEVAVPPGETLPADGVLLDTAAELDEALLTGESQPVTHQPGNAVLAGSINVSDCPLALRVERLDADTTLAQITRLLDGAQQHSSAAQRLADRIAGHFVVAIIVIAGAGFAWTLMRGHDIDASLSVALAVLVASCPCALSLATPIVIAAASSRLAGEQVLVANPDALLRLTDIDTVVFDKTGTLTQPQLVLQQTVALGSVDTQRCLEIAAALERDSRHPIAQAFHSIASPLRAEDTHHVPGVGIDGWIDGHHYSIRSSTYTGTNGATWIDLCQEASPVASFALAAIPRPEAADTIAALRGSGIHTLVLSGDDEGATSHLAQQLRLDNYVARQTPADKLQRLKGLQRNGAKVLAVGDGINDAPLLAAADASAAMPQGAALTQSKADFILLGDSLNGLLKARRTALQARQRIRENLLWALFYNLAVLPLAILGVLSPWMAAAGMSLSSLLVAANALRLGSTRAEATASAPLLQEAGS
jgi:Cu2+-exporting ATPase